MPKPQSVQIQEQDQSLEIRVGWNPTQGFMTVFASTLWLVFLAVLTGGFKAEALFASSMHILVGCWMFYTGLCYMVNSTIFAIADGDLRVWHEPLPWWRGSRVIGINEIDQLFFKESLANTDDNGTKTYSYTLHARLIDGTHKQLMYKSNLDKEEALKIEQKLEHYLGIVDERVWGEVPGKTYTTKLRGPRPARRQYTDPALTRLYHTEKNGQISFDQSNWVATAAYQYDWSDGSSDRELVLTNESDEKGQLYIAQHKTFLHAFKESPLSEQEINRLAFLKEAPPAELSYKGQTYTLNYQQHGKRFPGEDGKLIWVQQWIYETADSTEHLRIQHIAGELFYYRGALFHYQPPVERLDLDTLPEKEIDYQQPDWRGKDFV